MGNSLTVLATVISTLLLSAIALKFLPVPFAWIGLFVATACFVIASRAGEYLRFPLVIAGSVPLALALAEIFFSFAGRAHVSREGEPFFDPDPLLGWKLKPSSQVRRRATVSDSGEVIYDVLYSTDAEGRRVSPSDRGEDVIGCLLFFSDSFTFGEGVDDSSVFPYQVGLLTDGYFRIVNLAVPAYGAEQMLAAVERGNLNRSLPCSPSHIIYVALPHHVARAAGTAELPRRGPTYKRDSAGGVKYVGTKTAQPRAPPTSTPNMRARLVARLVAQVETKSRVYEALASRPTKSTEADISLYFGVVRQAFDTFARLWPRANRYVVGWGIHPFYAGGLDRFHDGLQTVNATIYYIDNILPNYTEDPVPYGLHRSDLHPNEAAHSAVAAYIVQNALEFDSGAIP